MKLITFLIFSSLAFEAMAGWQLPRFSRDDDDSDAIRVVWSCQTENRGDMPEEKEVQISYDEEGKVVFRPDIFRKRFNPIRALNNLFGRRRSANDVDECLRTFVSNLPANISQDVGLAIRESDFFSRYQRELEPVASILPLRNVVATRPNPLDVPQTVANLESNQNVQPAEAEVPTAGAQVQATAPELNPQIERARAQLLDYMIDNSSALAGLRQYSTQCPQLENTSDNGYCRWKFNQNSRLLNNLSRMFAQVRNEPVPVSTVLHSLDCAPDHFQDVDDLEDILHRMDRKNQCAPLANVGDYKVFRRVQGRLWHNSGAYLLKKTGENQYDLTMNLNFTMSGGSISPQQMMAKVRECLAMVNPRMRGPNGESIRLNAFLPNEIEARLPRSERPDPAAIEIVPDNYAIDSGHFHSQIDCPTLTHELFHHLGLADEYHEDRTNNFHSINRADEWSCRRIPSGNSIMKNHITGFNESVPRQFTCECVNDACRSALRSSDQASQNFRKILMSESPNSIIGNAGHCRAIYTSTVATVSQPDQAYVNVVENGPTLSFGYRALFMVNGRFQYSPQSVTCTCPEGDEECLRRNRFAARRMRSNPGLNDCPSHTTRVDQAGVAPENAATTINGDRFTFVTTPTEPSVIKPNHFHHLLSGMCDGPASLYNQCASYAYISRESPECTNVPAACEDGSQFYGTSEEQ